MRDAQEIRNLIVVLNSQTTFVDPGPQAEMEMQIAVEIMLMALAVSDDADASMQRLCEVAVWCCGGESGFLDNFSQRMDSFPEGEVKWEMIRLNEESIDKTLDEFRAKMKSFEGRGPKT